MLRSAFLRSVITFIVVATAISALLLAAGMAGPLIIAGGLVIGAAAAWGVARSHARS